MLVTGSSDCTIKAFQQDRVVCTFEQDSAITHLCPLSENTFLSAASSKRQVRVWDVRAPTQSVKLFESCHYSEIKAIEKLNDEIFATSALDGIINIWNTRMNKLLTSINVHE
jgi:WD40 repeat protein